MNVLSSADGTLTYAQRCDFVEHFDRDLWRKCYPRTYSEPAKCGSYYSSKSVARFVAEIVLRGNGILVCDNDEQSKLTEAMAALRLSEYDSPTIWISQEMAWALQRTMPPMELDWGTMPLPFEACAFMLPKGSLIHSEYGDVEFIAYARFKKDEVKYSSLPGMGRFGMDDTAIIIIVRLANGVILHVSLNERDIPAIRVPELDTLLLPFQSSKLNNEDEQCVHRALQYIMNAVLLMTDPDAKLITPAKLIKKVPAKGGKHSREFWTPRILGEHFHVRREAQDLGGIHASPRLHWVRGYWREQAYGAANTLRKRIWIEPFMRGLADVA